MNAIVSVMPAYETVKLDRACGVSVLRTLFRDGEANSMNFCLFSTSGTHGSYLTIEDVAASLGTDEPEQLTVLVIQPRVVRMLYGDIDVEPSDIDFLKQLRESSKRAVAGIG